DPAAPSPVNAAAKNPPSGTSPPAAGQPPASPASPAPTTSATESSKSADPVPKKSSRGMITASFEDVALSPQARVLAERIKCVCGCNDPLVICTCKKTPGSQDMKKYLQELVDAGKTPGEIESAMVARYGPKALP